MAYSFESEDHNPFKRYFTDVVNALLVTADRSDWDEFHLRVAAYESLNVVLASAPPGTGPAFEKIANTLVSKLEATFKMQVMSRDDLMEVTDLQSLLCGVLQVTYNKIGSDMNVFSDRVMTCLLSILSERRSSDVHEDALLAISAVCDAAGRDFQKYMSSFRPILFAALENIAAYNVNAIAVGLVGDVARAIDMEIQQYCDVIITNLLNNLQNGALDRSVKPAILSCFGDIATVISTFRFFLPFQLPPSLSY